MPDTATETTIVALTADDLAALKMCDEITLHVNPDGFFIRAYIRAYGDPVIYTAKQQRLFTIDMYCGTKAREIATTADAMGYGGDDGSTSWRWDSVQGWSGGEGPARPSCFYTAYDGEVWATIVRSLKVGDRLHTMWTADNNNGHSREAGLHVDQVKLLAFREPVSGSPIRHAWHMGWQIGRDDSARMIRRHGQARF